MQISLTLALVLGATISPDARAAGVEQKIVLNEVRIVAYEDGAAAEDEDGALPIVDAEDAADPKKPPGPKPKGCSVGDARGNTPTLALLGLVLVFARRRR